MTFYIGKYCSASLRLVVLWGYNDPFGIVRNLSDLMLFIWAIFPIVQRNINRFKAKQDKATTFDLAIKNLILYHGVGDHPVDRVSDPEMITIRNGAPADEFFLKEMTYQAIYSPKGGGFLPRKILEEPASGATMRTSAEKAM